MVLITIIGCAPMDSRYYIRHRQISVDERHYEFVIPHIKTKNEAFSITENLIAKNYTSPWDVILQSDKESGVIVVKSTTPFSVGDFNFVTNYAFYTMEVRVKDNKTKLTFDLGGVSNADGIQEHPGTAPPVYEMPKIRAKFNLIKANFEAAFNSTHADF